jgi:hypothetical protein
MIEPFGTPEKKRMSRFDTACEQSCGMEEGTTYTRRCGFRWTLVRRLATLGAALRLWLAPCWPALMPTARAIRARMTAIGTRREVQRQRVIPLMVAGWQRNPSRGNRCASAARRRKADDHAGDLSTVAGARYNLLSIMRSQPTLTHRAVRLSMARPAHGHRSEAWRCLGGSSGGSRFPSRPSSACLPLCTLRRKSIHS